MANLTDGLVYMKVRFYRTLMQRFRSILHLIDPLLNRGHEVCLSLGREKFRADKFYPRPWNIHAADANAMNHLVYNFGLKVEGLNKVSWTKDKYAPCDLVIKNDAKGGKNKTPNGVIAIPYIGFEGHTPRGRVTTGNFMCQDIRIRQQSETEKKGMVLIIHPGGGRDFLSPKRQKYAPASVIANNIQLMSKTISYLPDDVSEIIIKTHPAPYLTCDRESMVLHVLPSLKSDCPISVCDDDLIGLICKSEFIVNYGSSTSVWLLGSPKKWVNIVGQCQFNMKAKNRRDRVERAENWWDWTQNIPLEGLRLMLENYESRVDRSSPLMKKYADLYNMDAVGKCVEIIEKFGR